ncbi:MAG: restriction endonuclease subunit S [Bacteroidaceae bacterium]|nr:restriction endonuclease subunit S [Bacteroidaceae bacterium]
MAADKQDKVLNVPNLRFPEFKDEWELHPTTDFFEFKNGLNPDSKRFGSGTKFISVMDILNNRYITYDKIIAFVEPKENDLKEYGVNYGDILFQRSSETLEDVGRANVYLDKKTALFGGFVIRGKKIGEYNPLFFRYLLSSPHVRKRIVVKGAGAQHFNIGQDGLSKVYIFVPTTKEQERIARLLDLLDERIETQIRIIDKLQSLMKGLAEHFTAFTPNIKIADCLNCHSSILQENQVKDEGKYKVYGANGICGYSDSPAILEDTILIVKDGSGVGNVSYASGEYSVIGTSNYLTAKSGYSLKYLYYCLMIFNFVPYRTGMAIPHIYFKDYGKALIYCPSLDKQIQIATLLSKIECKIEAEKTITDSYQQQKRFLLQSMFI